MNTPQRAGSSGAPSPPLGAGTKGDRRQDDGDRPTAGRRVSALGLSRRELETPASRSARSPLRPHDFPSASERPPPSADLQRTPSFSHLLHEPKNRKSLAPFCCRLGRVRWRPREACNLRNSCFARKRVGVARPWSWLHDGEGDPASALGPGFTATQRGRRPCPEPLAGGQSPGRRCGPRRRAFAAGTLPPVPARATMARRPPPKHSGPGRGDNAPTSETPSSAEGPAFFLAFGPFGEGVKCPACGCQQRRGAARPGRHQDEGQDGKQLGRASAGGRTRGRAGWAAWLAGGGHSRPG